MSLAENSKEVMISAAMEAQVKGADLIEIRLDCLERLTEEKISGLFRRLKPIRIPKVATIMPDSIFGHYEGNDKERARLLAEASRFAEYVDIDKEMDPGLFEECLGRIKSSSAQPIISWHSQRLLKVEDMRDFISAVNGRTVFKVVMPATRFEDNLVALDASNSLTGRRIIFCYGPFGRISRVLAPFFGSEWTYASLKEGKESAPGQVDLQTMRRTQEVFLG